MPAARGSFCLGLMLSCLLPTPAAAQEPDSLAARAGRLFQRWDSLTTPGCAAAVDSGGTVRFSRAYGAADLESGRTNTPETVFLAASLAKQFTAMSVLLLEHMTDKAHAAQLKEEFSSSSAVVLTEYRGLTVKNLKKGHKVRVTGLGIFQVKKRPARMGRNPATGEQIKIKASKKLAFRAAKEVKEAI